MKKTKFSGFILICIFILFSLPGAVNPLTCDPGCTPIDCNGEEVCMFASCSFSNNCPDGDVGVVPDPVTDYPKYSYDFAEPYSQQIELKRNSCSDDPTRKFKCSGTNIQLVKFIDRNANNYVGLLEINSESVDKNIFADGEKTGNTLLKWSELGEKKTYRFCVESKDQYLVYKESADSLLKDSEPNEDTILAPLRFKFAIKVLP
ncbi:MAG: hypothetical protein V1702_05880 [Candidatus Woesearchaeota archaeon]